MLALITGPSCFLVLDNSLSPDAAVKFLLLFVAMFALFAFARRLSRRDDQNAPFDKTQFSAAPPEIAGLIGPPARLPERAASPPDGPNQFTAFAQPNLGPVRIVQMNFKTFDAEAGPPDGEVFADELFVELANRDTGHSWVQSYFAASPKGLERLLRDKNWDSVFAHDVFVFRRYDLAEIRRTLLEHIAEEQKLVLSGEPATGDEPGISG